MKPQYSHKKKMDGKFGVSAVLGLLALVVIVVILGFLTRMNTEYFENTFVTHTLEHLRTISKTEGQHVEKRIIDIHGTLKVLAENPKVKAAIINGWTDEDGPVVNGYNPEKLVYDYLSNNIRSLYRLDNKGIIQTRLPWKKGKAGDDYSLKPGVKKLLKDHRSYVSGLFKTDSGIYCFSICFPVFDQKQFIGILRAVIDLNVIHDCLKNSNIGQNGYAWIIDSNGIVISHHETKYVGKNIITAIKEANPSHDWTKIQGIVERMTKGEKGVGFLCCMSPWDEKLKDTNKLTAFVPIRIKDQRWSLGTVLDYNDISTPVKLHSKNVTAGAALLMLTFFGAGGWFYKVQKEKAKLIIEAESADKLRSVNQQLTDEITERKQAEEKLRKTQESTQQLNEKLHVLHEVTIELTKAESTDEVCRLAIKLAHKKLGFPRIGIWLKGAEPGYQCGTFGIDEKGNIRDERDLRFKVKKQGGAPWKHIFFGHEEMIIERDCLLYDARGKAVGKGSRISVRIWDGKDSIGIIFVDDLLEPGVITDELIMIIKSFASTIGHLYSQKCVEEQIESSLEEKELLLKEIHHRTKNNFQVISSMLYLQSEYFNDEKVFDVFEKSQNRIKSMAAVHEQLYQSEDLTSIDFAEYARELLVSLYHSSGISEGSIGFKINIDHVFLGLDLAVPCGLIINELFSNSLEHAFPGLNKGDNPNAQISIDMHKNDGQGFTLVVSDNGTGFEGNINSTKSKSLGLLLVKNLAEQLDGTVELETDKGTKFTIKFPSNLT